jgi:hypothetical protein
VVTALAIILAGSVVVALLIGLFLVIRELITGLCW